MLSSDDAVADVNDDEKYLHCQLIVTSDTGL